MGGAKLMYIFSLLNNNKILYRHILLEVSEKLVRSCLISESGLLQITFKVSLALENSLI